MPATRLYATVSVEEQWSAVAGPWLRALAGAAWKNQKPTVILTPSRAESFYLRSRIVEEGMPFLGLRFWTPSDARKFLLAELLPKLGMATLAEQRLVVRACAEKLAREAAGDNATLTSVIREPGAFLRAYDLLLGAGWDPAKEGAPYGRELAREVQRGLKKFGIATQAGLHQLLRREVSAHKKTLLANLLVLGFNATHWPLWDLLKAVAFSADEAVVVLSEPRVFGEDVDQLWLSSWEEITGGEAISPIDGANGEDTVVPFAALVASYEKGEPGDVANSELTFCVTPDLATHVRAVVLQALDYLKRDSCARLGIVFPEANALALGVGDELRRLGVPLDDGTGSLQPGLFERRCWPSWIALQEEPGVTRLIAWVRACEAQGVSYGALASLTAREVADILENALGESLVDDLDFLAGHLEATAQGERAPLVIDFLRRRIVLMEEGTFAEFLRLTRHAMDLPGWENHLASLWIDPPAWLLKDKSRMSRRTFLEWLKEATDSQTRTRGAEGNHFYGKVHLTIYAQLSGQSWSHLILTGLNEGVWPRVFETGAFGSRHELIELNQKARGLNRRSTAQGGQGEGHETVAPEYGHCLLPLERQDLALRDLCAALEATSEAVALTAMTTEAGRSLLPSDFFNHAYQAKTGRTLEEETFREMADTTRAWCARHEFVFASNEAAGATSIDETRSAYAARRDSTQAFGPYEFSYAQPPSLPIQLRCKRWEDAWNHPATVWLEEIVGASSWPEGTLSWQRAVGTWAHRWLTVSLRECRERNTTDELPALLRAAADRDGRARAPTRARFGYRPLSVVGAGVGAGANGGTGTGRDARAPFDGPAIPKRVSAAERFANRAARNGNRRLRAEGANRSFAGRAWLHAGRPGPR